MYYKHYVTADTEHLKCALSYTLITLRENTSIDAEYQKNCGLDVRLNYCVVGLRSEALVPWPTRSSYWPAMFGAVSPSATSC